MVFRIGSNIRRPPGAGLLRGPEFRAIEDRGGDVGKAAPRSALHTRLERLRTIVRSPALTGHETPETSGI